MLGPLRRPTAAIAAALLIPALAACGSDSDSASDDKETSSASASSSEAAADGLSEVTFEGDVGDSLTATWHSEVAAPESTTVTTLVKGDGEEVADGDTVSTYLYLGNGTTQKDAFSDYDNGAPESLPNDGQLGDVFTKLFTGATYGSRVVAVTTPGELFGPSGARATSSWASVPTTSSSWSRISSRRRPSRPSPRTTRPTMPRPTASPRWSPRETR